VPNYNYQKGYRAELHIVRTLRAAGWEAQRTAASHGPFDVIAVAPKCILLIQSKSGGRPSPSDYKSLIDLTVPSHVLKLAIWFPDGPRAGRILYCADAAGLVSVPNWCAGVRWFEGEPPKIQMTLPLRSPTRKRRPASSPASA
jgi:hypothetical protein